MTEQASPTAPALTDREISERVDELLGQMTVAEKAGQLTQYFYFPEGAGPNASPPPDFHPADSETPHSPSALVEAALGRGEVGSLLFVTDPAEINRLQRLAVDGHRLGIPALFGFDVIHGLRTIFPVPIAMAASWDPETIERGQAVAAREARAVGIHWAFAPMVDIARDPRWGRIIEGAGEDPYLGSAVAVAQVRGFQGPALGTSERVIAGPKHLAGYGAAIGGRDYDEVNLSDSELWNVYLPPFAAVVAAGAGNIMSAYMDLNGIPATGNRWLINDVLRGTWGFEGFVVSDAQAVHDLHTHGFAADLTDAGARGAPCGRRSGDGCWRSRVRPPPRGVGAGSGHRGGSWTPASGGSSRPSCGWVCSTSRTLMRTGRGRFSPTRATARSLGWRPSGRRCCCATRAACYP